MNVRLRTMRETSAWRKEVPSTARTRARNAAHPCAADAQWTTASEAMTRIVAAERKGWPPGRGTKRSRQRRQRKAQQGQHWQQPSLASVASTSRFVVASSALPQYVVCFVPRTVGICKERTSLVQNRRPLRLRPQRPQRQRLGAHGASLQQTLDAKTGPPVRIQVICSSPTGVQPRGWQRPDDASGVDFSPCRWVCDSGGGGVNGLQTRGPVSESGREGDRNPGRKGD
jgi:hypothetical protein